MMFRTAALYAKREWTVERMAEWINNVTIDMDKIRYIIFKVNETEYCIHPLDFLYAIKYAVKKSGGKVVERKDGGENG